MFSHLRTTKWENGKLVTAGKFNNIKREKLKEISSEKPKKPQN
jgi:hypothetical protein